MNLSIKTFNFLQDPETVAKFQRYCGIHVRREESKKNGCACHANDNHNNSDNANGNGVMKRALENGNKNHHLYQNGSNTHTNGYKNGYTKIHNQCCCDKLSKQESRSEKTLSYDIKNPFLFYLFNFGANLGNEIFYMTFFPFCLWNIDSLIARKVCIMWCFVMYIGQASKDIIKWPRPRAPPVVQLEERYALEYGMPSTHAMVGIVIPLGMTLLLEGRYEFPFWVAMVIVCCWSTLVALSRVYLGMHSFMDVIAGIVYTLLLMPLIYPFLDVIDQFQVTHAYAPLVMVPIPAILLYFYPHTEQFSTTRGDTAMLLTVCSGLSVGTWLNFQQGLMQPGEEFAPIPVVLPGLSWFVSSFIRFFIGVTLLGFVRLIMKPLTLWSICRLLGVDSKDTLTQQNMGLEIPHKCCSYLLVSITAVHTSPMLLSYLGVMRMAYYSEI